MAPVISLFNHKGGVSKTTTTFNLGWALADLGHRVLIVDGDPQCNLTGTVLGFDGIDDFGEFYSSDPKANISAALAPVFQSTGVTLSAAPITDTTHKNLFLLAGNIDLSENETQISVALSTPDTIPALQNMPGSLCALLRITADVNGIDIVIVDMSPSVGAINQCFLMGSDYFIVPTSPDYYCNQAISSLSRVLPRWHQNAQRFRSASQYPLPSAPPRFCGIISQRYLPRGGSPAKSFQKWIDRIKNTVDTQLVPALAAQNMAITVAEFMNCHASDAPYNLINIADFNSLIAQSQEHSTPVFALTDKQIGTVGKILATMKTSRDSFKKSFADLASSIETITGIGL